MANAVFAPIILDGAHGEGGGALIRTALAMSALTQQPMRIHTVRGNMRAQGLQAEDIAILEALRKSTLAETVGAEVGSVEFSFLPTRRPRSLDVTVEVPNAYDGPGHANAVIVLNALMPVLARTGSYSFLNLKGETFGMSALGFDAFQCSTIPAFRRLGLHVDADLPEAGFGRGSVGDLRAEIEPSELQGVDWSSRGELLSLRAIVSIAELPDSISDRAVSFLRRLTQQTSLEFEIEVNRAKSRTPGVHLTLTGEFENGYGSSQSMGAKGLRIESVVQSGFERFMDWFRSETTTDEYLIDQLIVAAAIAETPSTFKVHRLTQRFLTMVWVIKQFVPIHITVKGQEGEAGVVTVRR